MRQRLSIVSLSSLVGVWELNEMSEGRGGFGNFKWRIYVGTALKEVTPKSVG